jgi:hypothetical protein
MTPQTVHKIRSPVEQINLLQYLIAAQQLALTSDSDIHITVKDNTLITHQLKKEIDQVIFQGYSVNPSKPVLGFKASGASKYAGILRLKKGQHLIRGSIGIGQNPIRVSSN